MYTAFQKEPWKNINAILSTKKKNSEWWKFSLYYGIMKAFTKPLVYKW